MLENTCMKDEPPPPRRPGAVGPISIVGQAPPALMVSRSGLTGSDPGAPNRIDETPNDS